MSELIQMISNDTDLSTSDVRRILESFTDKLEKIAISGDEVSIKGLGKFIGDIKPPRPFENYLKRGNSKLTRGRIVIKFFHYDSRKKELWNKSPHCKVFKGDKRC